MFVFGKFRRVRWLDSMFRNGKITGWFQKCTGRGYRRPDAGIIWLIDGRKTRFDTSTDVKLFVGFVALFTVSILAGCGSTSGDPFATSTAANVAGNWQIQTSASSSSAQPQGVVLLGALEGSGSQVSGKFRFTNVARPTACGLNEVVALTGAIDSEGGLTLSSAPLPDGTTIKLSLKLTGTEPYSGIGSVEVDGTSCAVASAPAIGSQIASTSGTFTGTLAPGTSGAPASGSQGTGTLTLKQSASPGNDGQFTVTGTLNYKFGACAGQVPLSGRVSGVGISFYEIIFNSGSQQAFNLAGSTDLRANQIQAGYLSLSPAPCSADPESSAVFNGAFNRQ